MLYDMDTLRYAGHILSDGTQWEYREVEDAHLLSTTAGMPIKALLANLVCFGLVYDTLEPGPVADAFSSPGNNASGS